MSTNDIIIDERKGDIDGIRGEERKGGTGGTGGRDISETNHYSAQGRSSS